MAAAESAVVAEGLRKSYGRVRAVDGASFAVEAGEIVALLGPNGAGKTTTVEILEGYRRPDAGTARVLGLDPRRDRRALMPRIGVMLQEGGVAPGLRPAEAVRLFASFYAHPADPDEVLALAGLAEAARTPIRRLSGGQRRRLAFALALAGRPEVCVLDEPTAGMDPHGRAGLEATVRRLADGGTAILLTTHDMGEAERLADQVVIIDRGRVVARGPLEEIRRAASAETRFSAASGLDIAALGRTLGAAVEEETPGEYRVAAPGDPALVSRLTGWLAERGEPLGDLRAGRQRLEDVFLRLTRPAGTGPAGTRPAGTGPAGTGPAGTRPAGEEDP